MESVDVSLRELAPDELPAAEGVLGRAYRDTPTTIALLGDDRQHRTEVTGRIMRFRVAQMNPRAFTARHGDTLVGVCGRAPSDAPPLSREQQKEMIHILRGGGPGVVEKAIEMAGEWDRLKPKEPHWHLGPVAVEPEMWGHGIASLMISRFCERIDELGAMSYLETDKGESVRLYERFGFETIGEGPVIGVHNWFMTRAARQR